AATADARRPRRAVLPADVAAGHVDRLDHGLELLGGGAAGDEQRARLVLLGRRVGEDRAALGGGDELQAEAGVVGRRLPVGPAGDARIDQGALAGRAAALGEDRTAARVQALGPGLLDERLAEQELAGGAVEQVVEAVAVGPADRAALAAGERQVGEDRGLV